MRLKRNLILFSSISMIATVSQAKLEAHEWGTFTSLVGSNGITQNGMYHEDEHLPEFVHKFGEVRLPNNVPLAMQAPVPHRRFCKSMNCDVFEREVITQKMETPVIYFYGDKEQNVKVNVRFPEGVVTETYPAPAETSPRLTNDLKIANGNTTFDVKVLPQTEGTVPFVESANIYSHARNVASNIVKSGNETEKFIFYRGLGRFQPRVSIQSKNGALRLQAAAADLPQAAFLVDVDARGNGQMLKVSGLKAGQALTIPADQIQRLRHHFPSHSVPEGFTSGVQSRDVLIGALVQSGLRQDEATAMINTWEHGYLKVPGLRLLYILPRQEVDQVLPLTMTPAPDKLARVFVGRIEILLDSDEKALLNQVTSVQQNEAVRALGRFAEPILHRLLELTPGNQTLERLLDLVRRGGEITAAAVQ